MRLLAALVNGNTGMIWASLFWAGGPELGAGFFIQTPIDGHYDPGNTGKAPLRCYRFRCVGMEFRLCGLILRFCIPVFRVYCAEIDPSLNQPEKEPASGQ